MALFSLLPAEAIKYTPSHSEMKKNGWFCFLGIAALVFVATDKSIPSAALLCFTGVCSAVSAVCELIERNRK